MKIQQEISITTITGMIIMTKAIIFDLDGTLLDTLNDLADSVNHVLTNHNMKNRTVDEIRSFIGNGVPTLIARSVPSGTDEKTYSECVREMAEYYKDHADIKTKPYDGIIELLETLKTKGIRTAVVTNKVENAAVILCKSKFGDSFDCVIGDNGKDRLKPHPDNVFRALDILGFKKEEVLYAGDSDVDMITAKNAQLRSIGVTWGFRDENVLRESGADFIVHIPAEILKIL